MLRAMLVDDEQIALEGLRLLIDWEAEGFAICAECSSATEALAVIDAAKPDLIVTDIRMPGMDGLALMEAVKLRGFDGQFVVVTGYGDFNLARQALSLGVAGYLLKPIEPAEASEVLEHVRKQLVKREATGEEQHAGYQRAMTALLSGQEALSNAFAVAHCWRIATWGAPLPFEVVRSVLATFPAGTASAHIVEDQEYLTLRWPDSQPEPLWSNANAVLTRHKRTCLRSEICMQADALLAERKKLAAGLSLSMSGLPTLITALVRAIALREVKECLVRCTELDRLCDAYGATARAHVRMRLIAECGSLLAHKPTALELFLREQHVSLQALCLMAIRLLAPLQESISERVMAFVDARLTQRITLEMVAESLGYNATYLGRVFREESGFGFREWLNHRRIVHAQQLLLTTDVAVYRVAEQVGYQHYKRFLEHFKRQFHMPPEQYRQQHRLKNPS